MPKMDFLDPPEAEKINKQKWKQFCWTPCNVCIFSKSMIKNKKKQAGAELGQAQLKLGLGFTSTNLH